MRKAIFFDRDGTLNEFKLGDYITQVEELVLLSPPTLNHFTDASKMVYSSFSLSLS